MSLTVTTIISDLTLTALVPMSEFLSFEIASNETRLYVLWIEYDGNSLHGGTTFTTFTYSCKIG